MQISSVDPNGLRYPCPRTGEEEQQGVITTALHCQGVGVRSTSRKLFVCEMARRRRGSFFVGMAEYSLRNSETQGRLRRHPGKTTGSPLGEHCESRVGFREHIPQFVEEVENGVAVEEPQRSEAPRLALCPFRDIPERAAEKSSMTLDRGGTGIALLEQ